CNCRAASCFIPCGLRLQGAQATDHSAASSCYWTKRPHCLLPCPSSQPARASSNSARRLSELECQSWLFCCTGSQTNPSLREQRGILLSLKAKEKRDFSSLRSSKGRESSVARPDRPLSTANY